MASDSELKVLIVEDEEAISSMLERALGRAGFRVQTAANGEEAFAAEAQALTPGGKRQERVVNVFQFLDLYGPDFVRLTVERLDPLGLEHQVVFMETLSASANCLFFTSIPNKVEDPP